MTESPDEVIIKRHDAMAKIVSENGTIPKVVAT
jgi:hypothetical protein